MPVYAPPSEVFVRGEGVNLITEDGDKYLDFVAGIAVSSLGHSHPKLVEVLQDQAANLWHLSNMFRVRAGEELADKMCARTFADRVFFTNSGTEAVECALKAARKYHWSKGNDDRIEFITFTGAFHGRSLGAINAGGNPKYLEGFGPAIEGFRQLEWGDHDALKEAVTDKTCAVFVEPVQGEGGVRAMPEECLTGLRKLCDETGTLLIYDEVQCGMGRTGKLFAHEWAENAQPDIMCVAKGVGGGFPFGACLMTEEVGLPMQPGSHGSTYGGNPLAMAVGNAVWDIISDEAFLAEVRRVSGTVSQGLKSLADSHPDKVEGVTGKGLLTGLKLKSAPKPVQNACREKGLLVGVAGNNVLRLAPPLIIEDSDVRKAVSVMDEALSEWEMEG
ncbi:aspartate aminotransferase family protein [Thalassovita mediterranea]|nr:aspartate aminotransferase family protein [Thalassovita mediterranea]